MSATVDARAALAADIGALTHDPEAFVLYAFPWGRGELAGCEGPDAWQRAVLREIGATLRGGAEGARAVREAVASGHGIGKSALVAWIMLWALSTCPDTRGVVTANTEAQLKGKTWAELAKWHRLCLCGDWFGHATDRAGAGSRKNLAHGHGALVGAQHRGLRGAAQSGTQGAADF